MVRPAWSRWDWSGVVSRGRARHGVQAGEVYRGASRAVCCGAVNPGLQWSGKEGTADAKVTRS